MAKKPPTSAWRGELVECPMQHNLWLSREWCRGNQSLEACGNCPYNEGRLISIFEEKQNRDKE